MIEKVRNTFGYFIFSRVALGNAMFLLYLGRRAGA